MKSWILLPISTLLGLASHLAQGQTGHYSVAAATFVPLSSQSDYQTTINLGACISRTSSDPAVFAQAVRLPDGARVDLMRLFFADTPSAAPGVQLSLINTDGGQATTLASVASHQSMGNVVFRTVEVALDHTVDAAEGALSLLAELDGGDSFCGATLRYQSPAGLSTQRSLNLSGYAFVPERSFTSWADFGQGCRRLSSNPPPIAFANVAVPQGARITSMDFDFFDDNSTQLGEILLRLNEDMTGASSFNTLATVVSEPSMGQGLAQVTLDHIVGERALFLDWSQAIAPSNLALCGARINYLSDAPAAPLSGRLQLSAAGFIPTHSTTRYRIDGGCLNHVGAGTPGQFAMDVQLPDGASVSRLVLDLVDNDTANDVTVKLWALDADPAVFNGVVEIASATSSGAAAGHRSLVADLGVPFTVDREEHALVLLATLEDGSGNANLKLCGVAIEYGDPALFADGFEAKP